MVSTLLSFTIIALSLSGSRALMHFLGDMLGDPVPHVPVLVKVDPHLSNFHRTRDGKLRITGPHIPIGPISPYSVEERFRSVIHHHSTIINKREWKPLSDKSIESWTRQGRDYHELTAEDQAVIRELLADKYPDDPLYLWSLSRSSSPSVWWNDKFMNGDAAERIDLVKAGDSLHFSDRNFKMDEDKARLAATQLTQILSKDGEGGIRKKTLPVRELMAYTDEKGAPIYELRVARVMNVLLNDFRKQKKHAQQRNTLKTLFLLVGHSPQDASKKAEKLLTKISSGKTAPLPSGRALSYSEIKNALD